MGRQFECPACGGMIDYPKIDELIDEYDLLDEDEYYYEDVFEDQLTVICDWCKKRVEVPIDLPEEHKPMETEGINYGNENRTANGKPKNLWPNTWYGRITLVAMLVVIVISSFLYVIALLLGHP
jgi:hypothetical protein